jgi:predicted PurR-regulated permease PerM
MNDISISLNIPTLIFFSITLLAIGVCLFLIGYFIGKQSVIGVSNVVNNVKPTSFFNEESSKNKPLSINDTKYVVDIKTSDMEKKYESLGDIKKSEENISNSINKLKNMKR